MEDTGSQPKTNRRRKSKYPALSRKYNLKLRQDYIEPDYVNGVFNDKGEMVIRPLNDEEKEFLNKFYEEVIGANFLYDDDLKNIHEEMKVLKKKKKLTKEETTELERLQDVYYRRINEILLYPDEEDRRQLYRENNQRNSCLMNRTKAAGRLYEINEDTYDSIHDNVYYCADMGENLIINQIERKVRVKVRDEEKRNG